MVKLPGFKKSKKQLAREKKREEIPATRKWPFALLLGLGLGILVLIDRGTLTADAGLASPCRVEVIAENTLPVRAGPDADASTTGTLRRGDLRGAKTTVQNGYRQLSDGTWALDQFLRPVPGSDCTGP